MSRCFSPRRWAWFTASAALWVIPLLGSLEAMADVPPDASEDEAEPDLGAEPPRRERDGPFHRFPDVPAGNVGSPAPPTGVVTGAAEAEARSLFERGAAALAEGRHEHARSFFQRSLELHGHPATAFNLATTLAQLGEITAAVELLEGLAHGVYGAIEASERAEVNLALRETRGRLSRLSVEVRGPDAARVRIDGEDVGESGTSPLELSLDPGRHRVRIYAEGYTDLERAVDLPPGRMVPLSVTLTPVLGTLVIEAADVTQTIEIEGIGTARGRLRRRLQPGSYVVRLPATGTERVVSVEAARVTTVRLEDEESLWNEPWLYVGIGAALVALVVGVIWINADDGIIRDENFGVVETLTMTP